VDQRIRTLQSQLGITDAQMPLWSAFAQAMRDNAASAAALFTERASALASMSAVDNMHAATSALSAHHSSRTLTLATLWPIPYRGFMYPIFTFGGP
jgi:hypothetical protein